MKIEFQDDELKSFEAQGAMPLPESKTNGHVEHDGARIWYGIFGVGHPVVLLHGGLGHSGNFGHQVNALVHAGYQVISIDSRGHGRSTRDQRPFSYELMASDVLAVMDHLSLARAALVGWSDGACTALILATQSPERVVAVFFFACNMDPSGAKKLGELGPVIKRCLARHKKDYASLSATPDRFDEFAQAVGVMMATQPNYSVSDLAEIIVPVTVVQSEQDEFIKLEHARYLASSMPDAEFILLREGTHFAPLQRPADFNEVLLAFLRRRLSPAAPEPSHA